MISVEYCQKMARYNAWQNRQLTEFVDALPSEEISKPRGAFFGSILGTLNHILWGDMMWMARFDGGALPSVSQTDSPGLTPTAAVWSAERFRMDGRIERWAASVSNLDLSGELRWYSGTLGAEMAKPMSLLVVHFFNHQTHHRGQVHAMLTAAGSKAPVTDLFLMPEDA